MRLHEREEGFHGLTPVVAPVDIEAVGLVDEEDPTECLLAHFGGLEGGLAEVSADEIATVHFDDVSLLQQPEMPVEPTDQACDRGLPGAGIAREDEMRRRDRVPQPGFLALMGHFLACRQLPDLGLHRVQTHQFVELGEHRLKVAFSNVQTSLQDPLLAKEMRDGPESLVIGAVQNVNGVNDGLSRQRDRRNRQTRHQRIDALVGCRERFDGEVGVLRSESTFADPLLQSRDVDRRCRETVDLHLKSDEGVAVVVVPPGDHQGRRRVVVETSVGQSDDERVTRVLASCPDHGSHGREQFGQVVEGVDGKSFRVGWWPL